MNVFEEIAVSTYLSYWDEEIEYSMLINRLKSDEFGTDEDCLSIWQPFEDYPGEFIAECIETLRHRLAKTFDRRAR